MLISNYHFAGRNHKPKKLNRPILKKRVILKTVISVKLQYAKDVILMQNEEGNTINIKLKTSAGRLFAGKGRRDTTTSIVLSKNLSLQHKTDLALYFKTRKISKPVISVKE